MEKKIEKKIIARAERVLKGGANKTRLKILECVSRENITSVWAISHALDIDFRNISHHLAKLEKAGLIEKFHQCPAVYHALTPYGEKVLKFTKDLS